MRVWVANMFDDTVTRIDSRVEPSRRQADPRWRPTDGNRGGRGLGVGLQRAGRHGHPHRREDRQGALHLAAGRRAAVGNPDFAGIAVGDGSVWVVSPSEGTVVRLDAESNRPKGKPIAVGAGPTASPSPTGTVWVANTDDGTVTRIDARTGEIVGQPIAVGGQPVASGGRGRRHLGRGSSGSGHADRCRVERLRARSDPRWSGTQSGSSRSTVGSTDPRSTVAGSARRAPVWVCEPSSTTRSHGLETWTLRRHGPLG